MQSNKVLDFANFISYPKSGWHKVISKDVTIFFHTDPIPDRDNPSHRHNDLTSFVFYFRGEPILVDIGRFNYNYNHLIGSYGFSAKAHNCITIDDFGPSAGVNNRRIPDFYRSSKVQIKHLITSDQFQFEVSHNGYCRIFGDKIFHNRKFILSEKKLVIIDELKGFKKHNICTYFHWYPMLKLIKSDQMLFSVLSRKDNHFNGIFKYIRGLGNKSEIKSSLLFDNYDGLGCYFPNYGTKRRSYSLVFKQNEKLPIINKFNLEWGIK